MSGSHLITVTTTCAEGQYSVDGDRALALPTGQVIALAPDSETPYLADMFESRLGHTARIIGQLSESGPAVVLVDHTV